MDSEAGCSGDSSISDSSTSDNSESDISDLLSDTSSQKREKRKKEKRTRLCDTDDSSSRGGSTNGVGHDQITELNSPIRGADVTPGNHGLTSPIANKQDMLRARGLVKEAEDEAGDDASQSSTSIETESDRQQNQIAHNNEEHTMEASNVVTAETGLGEDGRDNSCHEMDPLHQLAAGDDLSLTHEDITEWQKPSIADRDRILAGNHIDWAYLGDNMNEEPDDNSDLMAILKNL